MGRMKTNRKAEGITPSKGSFLLLSLSNMQDSVVEVVLPLTARLLVNPRQHPTVKNSKSRG